MLSLRAPDALPHAAQRSSQRSCQITKRPSCAPRWACCILGPGISRRGGGAACERPQARGGGARASGAPRRLHPRQAHSGARQGPARAAAGTMAPQAAQPGPMRLGGAQAQSSAPAAAQPPRLAAHRSRPRTRATLPAAAGAPAGAERTTCAAALRHSHGMAAPGCRRGARPLVHQLAQPAAAAAHTGTRASGPAPAYLHQRGTCASLLQGEPACTTHKRAGPHRVSWVPLMRVLEAAHARTHTARRHHAPGMPAERARARRARLQGPARGGLGAPLARARRRRRAAAPRAPPAPAAPGARARRSRPGPAAAARVRPGAPPAAREGVSLP